MTPRLADLAASYSRLKIAIVGDFCLDRYLDIDPALNEVSIETGRTAYNVVRVRSQPGAAGTVLNNLVALGVGRIDTLGVIGDDGEGYELLRAMGRLPGVNCDGMVRAENWRTFTYCKPMVCAKDAPPLELDRFDSKNWSRLPRIAEEQLVTRIGAIDADAVVIMDQVDLADTGVATSVVRQAIAQRSAQSGMPVIADSRRGLREYPPLIFKMNATELGHFFADQPHVDDLEALGRRAGDLAARNGKLVFVTLSERGILAAEPTGAVHHAPSLPVRGPIDIVGAGDCVTANLIAALASGVSLPDTLRLAMGAASVVVHQLGTTGTASIEQIHQVLH